jgi:tetratricopeptide (TPR) repeat protein
VSRRSRSQRIDAPPQARATEAGRPASHRAHPAARGSSAGVSRAAYSSPWTHPALGAALVALVLYLPALGGGFLRDDHFLIERHPYLRSPGWPWRVLAADFWAPVSGATGMWRPLVVLSYWVDGHLGGWTPVVFHVVNAVAYALATGALALVIAASGAGATATWLSSLAFATMPAHVECVAWICGRTDVFCGLFGLAVLWLDGRARRSKRAWPGVLASLAFAGALLSKEVAVLLVAVLVVLEWTRRPAGAPLWRSAAWLAPYVGVTLLYLLLHRAWAPDPGALPVPDTLRLAASRAAPWSLLPGYLAFLWPWFAHSPDRAAPTIAANRTLESVVGVLALVALVAAVVVVTLRRSRLATPLALTLFTLVPPLAFASLRGYGLFGERHMFVPSAGVVWTLALVIPALISRVGGHGVARGAGALAAVLVLGGAVETLRSLPYYRDDEAMYRAMTEREPGNPSGWIGLAGVLTERGQIDQASPLLDRAERIDPGMASIPVGRARVAALRGAWEAVLAETQRAMALDPGLLGARVLHAAALTRLGRLPEAGEELDRLAREYPGHPEVATIQGQYLVAAGRPAEAVPLLEGAAVLLPDEPSLWDALGLASALVGRREEARAAFERVVAITPGYLEGWVRLAAACQQLGDAAGRDRALASAAALPGGRERVAVFLARLGVPPR